MILLLIAFAIIHTILNFVHDSRPTTFSCGLAGFYPKKNKKVDIQKLFILGVMNEERGTDSTGLTIGDVKFSGIDKYKKCRDFIENNIDEIYKVNTHNKPCILHTRKSTIGANNLANCHPFIYKNKNDYSFVIAHNGVLNNTHEIKNKFLSHIEDVDKSLFIDTHYIARSLAESFVGNCDEREILEFYKGNAALLYYDSKGTFKAWKGASNNIEERPLYYVETKNGWYFCSIESSLIIAFENKYEVHQVKNNELITFYNGSLERSEIINRTHEVETKYFPSKVNKPYTFDNDFEDSWEGYYTNRENSKYFRKDYSTKKNNDVIPFTSYNAPLFHPILDLNQLHYVDRHSKNAIEGEYKVATNVYNSKKIYSLFSNKSTYADKVEFHRGILIKDAKIFKNLKNNFNVEKYPTIQKFFEGEINRITNVLIDFIPFYDKDGLHTVIYKSKMNALGFDYISKFDKKSVYIETKFSSLNILLRAVDNKFIIEKINSYNDATY